MPEISIDCQNLKKSYGTAGATMQALKGLSLEVNSGETMMIVGPSGCGKTTLISIIAGTLRFEHGYCRVLDEDLTKLDDEELVKWRGREIGFVFQSFNLVPTLTVAENIAVPLLIQKHPINGALDRATEMLKLVGLGDRSASRVTELSGGQQQRVAIARALIHHPRLIVCDEPTSALDAHTGTLVLELLKRISREQGTTLLIVTHDHRIKKYADRIAEIEDGIVKRIRDGEKS